MKISSPQIYHPQYNPQRKYSTHRLKPLEYDTVTFGALKKTQFDNIDLVCVEKFKAPIEKFNSNEDFQNWSSKKEIELLDKDYSGRCSITKENRENILSIWSENLNKNKFKPSVRLLVLSSIVQGLNHQNDKLPPSFNETVFHKTIDNFMNNNPNNSSFKKMYSVNLSKYHLQKNMGNDDTGWIVIPSKKHEPKLFKDNIEKLKSLSLDSWCTKNDKADLYLSQGDFHIYMENGEPKIGIRFVNDKIEEIQDKKNSSIIPLKYTDIVNKHIEKNNFKISNRAVREFQETQRMQTVYDSVKDDLTKLSMEKDDEIKLLSYLGKNPRKDKDGKLTISDFNINKYLRLIMEEDFDIPVSRLLNNVKNVEGDVTLYNLNIESLPNLENVGKRFNYYMDDKNFKGAPKLKTVGDITITNSKLFPNIEEVKDLTLVGNRSVNLPRLNKIDGDLKLYSCDKLNKLFLVDKIGGNLELRDASKIKDLNKLNKINGNLYLGHSCSIENLSNLEKIDKNLTIEKNAKINDLGKLNCIGGKLTLKSKKMSKRDFKKIDIGYIEESKFEQFCNKIRNYFN